MVSNIHWGGATFMHMYVHTHVYSDYTLSFFHVTFHFVAIISEYAFNSMWLELFYCSTTEQEHVCISV